MKKKRMDVMLFEQGLVKSIDEARRVIMAGLAIADDKRIDKAGDMVPCDAHIRLKERLPYVSRGGLKLKYAIDYFQLNLKDALVLDIGSSTGSGKIILKEGDRVVVDVKNTNETQAQTLKGSLLGFSSAGQYTISASSTGMVNVNGK